ncbi:amino acid synthesis family protein [Bordetella sp. BOR01]|uniref:amino acid synthesis family protein n=1 Tax=Bordetella sp. BOR01 TaxID=2854779 RepID=UPI001C45796A|nr:amino acid synthesis family protein [Bordetella sp. BOR01]MBV7483315.1 amino acid synthesis family protein [Bordetella sp. BOR01]
MALEVRKVVSYIEETHIEGGKAAARPLLMVLCAAVVKNPWAGVPFTEDLRPGILRIAPPLGDLLVREVLRHAGSAERVEGYGKAAVVGADGEVEHASALIHTLRFGNKYRDAVGGTSYLSFTNSRGPMGCPIVVPMMHKNDEGMRSHYLTVQATIADAPAAGEIVVALGASVGGRPHHRIGDRYQDMQELGTQPGGKA